MRLQLSLGALAIGQLGSQLALQLLVLRRAGVGGPTDAFIAAQAVPTVLFAVLLMSMQSVWVPRLALAARDADEWRCDTGIAQGQAVLLFWAPVVVLVAASTLWLPILFPGFSAQQVQLAFAMTVPFFCASALNAHALLYTSALRARDWFLFGEVASLAGTLLALLAVALFVPTGNVVIAAWIIFSRALLVTLILHVKSGRPMPNVRSATRIPDMWKKMQPLVTGSAIYKTGPLVDRYWSSLAGAGAMTMLNLAQTAVSALATVIERAVCTPVVPKFARLVEAADWKQLRRLYRRTILIVAILTAACGLGLLLIKPFWNVVFSMVLRIEGATAGQIWLMCFLLLGFLFVAVSGTIAVAVFYALGDTGTPVKIGIGGFIVGVVLKSLAFLQFGITGLVAATSIYYLLNMTLFVILLERAITRRTII